MPEMFLYRLSAANAEGVLGALAHAAPVLPQLVAAGTTIMKLDGFRRLLLPALEQPARVKAPPREAFVLLADALGAMGVQREQTRSRWIAEIDAEGLVRGTIELVCESLLLSTGPQAGPGARVHASEHAPSGPRAVPGLYVLVSAAEGEHAGQLAERLRATLAGATGLRLAPPEGGHVLARLSEAAERGPLLASTDMRGGIRLRGYAAGPTTILLDADAPPPVPPAASCLAHLARILSSPEIGAVPGGTRVPRIVVATRRAGPQGNQPRVLGLSNEPEVAGDPAFTGDEVEVWLERVSSTAEEHERLRAELQALPKAGSRLQIVRAPAGVGSVADREHRLAKIREDIRRLEEERDRLEGSPSRPPLVLLRFTARQLRGLAETLRRFSEPAIERGHLRYAFQATTAGGDATAGVHFLLYESVQTGPAYPLGEAFWQSETGDQNPIEFWVDPGWWQQLRRGLPSARVFVPEGTMLTPPLHAYADQEMDRYLAHQLADWFPDLRDDPDRLPQRHYYVFSPVSDDKVRVEVLDATAFKPYRQRLAWLNDYLEYAQSIDNMAGFFAAAGAEEFRARQLAHARQSAEGREAELGEVVKAIKERLWGELEAFVARFEGEVRALGGRTMELLRLARNT